MLVRILAAALLIGMLVLIAIFCQPPQVVVQIGPPCRQAHVTMGIDDPLHQADRFQPLPCRRSTLPGEFAGDEHD